MHPSSLLRIRTPLWVLPVTPLTLAVAVAGCTGVGNRAYIIDPAEAGQASAWPAPSWQAGSGQQPAWILAAVHGDGPGDTTLAGSPDVETIRNLPKSRQGNPQEYEVFGQSYRVLESAAGFHERGQASWYGRKFHGRPTSSGEPYDMHALTAAHKHLPIPTFVQVTNLDNGREVVVKVNDRGPFVDDRIIDLSFAAAERLGMTRSGTANVDVQALSVHIEEASATAPEVVDVAEATPVEEAVVLPEPEEATADTSASPATFTRRFIQVGAFHDNDNARSLLNRLSGSLDSPARVTREPSRHQPGDDIFRVHIGPFDSDHQVLETLSTLAAMGLEGYETRRDDQPVSQ